ncbi:MAG: hypothetical protein U0Q18_29080 [Bryobacteraceae bacterium]
MFLKTKSIVFATLAVTGWFGSADLARATAPNVKYYCTGTFASPAVSGNDLLGLAGEPFTVSVIANTALAPTSHGSGWAKYTKLSLTGTVQSRLLPTPIAISSSSAAIQLSIGPTADHFTLFFPITIVGINLQITSVMQLPVGTITKLTVYPFSARATLNPATSNLVYSDGTNSTKLGMNGSLNAVYIAGAVAQKTSNATLQMASSNGGSREFSWRPEGGLVAVPARRFLIG